MKAKKLITLLLCAALLVTCTIMGTMAYLTDSKTVENAFTVGNVRITLLEADTDELGVPIDGAARVAENTYKLFPGRTYVKDPEITVLGGSEACYVFVELSNGLIDLLGDDDGIEAQMYAHGWREEDGIWYQQNPIPASSTDTVIPVFDSFTVPESAEGTFLSQFADEQIVITAFAVQADGFTSAMDAWNAYMRTVTSAPTT